MQTTFSGKNNFAFLQLMHACGRNIDFVFFIFHSSLCISRRFDDQSRDFFKLFYFILFIIFYESRLPQNLYHVTKFSLK